MEETPLIILPAKNTKRVPTIERAFGKSGIAYVKKESARIDESENGIYICDFVPLYPRLLEKLRILSRNGNPVISLYRGVDAAKKRYDFILYIPASTTSTVLRQLVRWLSMKEKSSNMSRSVHDQLEIRKREMVRELALASELQKSMLPKKFPSDIPFNFAHKYVPHEYIGGDFFDVIRIDATRVGLIIADVSGHGASAAFIVAMLKILLNHNAPNESSPARTLEKINKELCVMIQEHFVTAFYAVIDTDTLECKYCNAGHPRQFLIKRNGTIAELSPNGFLIGMFDSVRYENVSVQLSGGDRLFCYTDGIIEVVDNEGIPFGFERLAIMIEENKNKDIVQMSGDVLTQIIMYMKGTVFPDDITIFIAEAIEDI
jgi:serine phosphatase RsbU (regulator of sigma subunit)